MEGTIKTKQFQLESTVRMTKEGISPLEVREIPTVEIRTQRPGYHKGDSSIVPQTGLSDLYSLEVLGFCDPGQSTVGHLLDAPQASVLPLLLPQKASGLLTKPISPSNSPATETGSEIGISAQGDIRRGLLERTTLSHL